jgi:hypothetical protein
MVVCAIGAFTVNNSIFDVWMIVIFGVIGYVFNKLDYPLPPRQILAAHRDRPAVCGDCNEFADFAGDSAKWRRGCRDADRRVAARASSGITEVAARFLVLNEYAEHARKFAASGTVDPTRMLPSRACRIMLEIPRRNPNQLQLRSLPGCFISDGLEYVRVT